MGRGFKGRSEGGRDGKEGGGRRGGGATSRAVSSALLDSFLRSFRLSFSRASGGTCPSSFLVLEGRVEGGLSMVKATRRRRRDASSSQRPSSLLFSLPHHSIAELTLSPSSSFVPLSLTDTDPEPSLFERSGDTRRYVVVATVAFPPSPFPPSRRKRSLTSFLSLLCVTVD